MPRKTGGYDHALGTIHGKLIPEETWDKFLKEMVNAAGNMSRAAEITRISRMAVFDRRKVDPEFEARYQEARERGVDVLEAEAFRRANEGVEKPIHYMGMEIAVVREYSDGLMQFLLGGNRPKYRKTSVDVTNLKPETNPYEGLTQEQLAEALAQLTRIVK